MLTCQEVCQQVCSLKAPLGGNCSVKLLVLMSSHIVSLVYVCKTVGVGVDWLVVVWWTVFSVSYLFIQHTLHGYLFTYTLNMFLYILFIYLIYVFVYLLVLISTDVFIYLFIHMSYTYILHHSHNITHYFPL